MKCKICGGGIFLWKKGLFDDRHGYPDIFSVWKCKICGLAVTRPQINKNKVGEIYKKYYPRQNIDLSKIHRNDYGLINKFKLWRKGLLTNCQYRIPPQSIVLDVGCGLCFSLLELESIGCDAYGIDPDPNAILIAKKFDLNFHCGFIEDKPFKNIKFDYVIANQVLEHTHNPISFLLTCKQRLKKTGRLILSFPNLDSLSRVIFGNKWLHWHIPYHLNFFTKKSIMDLAIKTNLKVEKINTITPNMWTNLQWRRYLQRPKLGQRDMFWDGRDNKCIRKKKGVKVYVHSNILPRVVHLLEEHNYVNRIVDVLGKGDSWVVEFSKNL